MKQSLRNKFHQLLMRTSTKSNDENRGDRPIIFKQRWFILFVLAWLNFTNGFLWIGYASIADKVSVYYDISYDQVNYLSLVYPVLTIVLGLPVIWGIDHMGIRVTFIVCGWLNLCSSLFRLVSTNKDVSKEYKYTLVMVGQILGAIGQPLALFSPAQLASLWFPPHQRALATTIGVIGNPLGILFGSLLPSLLIKTGFTNNNIPILIIALISALLPTLGICHSIPPVPQAIFVDRSVHDYSFFEQLRMCFRYHSFIILSIILGCVMGIFTALSTLFQQIFCPFGYSESFGGYCAALLIGSGTISSLVLGIIADKTKALTEIVQFCSISSTFGIICFSVLAKYPSFEIPILIIVALIGAFGIALYSICLELGAEISYPVSENISTGILVVSGQVFSVVFIVFSIFLWQPLTIDVPQKCTQNDIDQPKDYWAFNVFISCVAVVACSAILLGFFPQYRRLHMESVLVFTQDSDGTDIDGSLFN